MISKNKEQEIYVWIWLPQEVNPVVAGKLIEFEGTIQFIYGRSYLKRENAIAVYEKELPLKSGLQPLLKGLNIPGCIRDASPDAWGRRVIINRLFGLKGKEIDNTHLSELTYLIESGSDRTGALDFQKSSRNYQPRFSENVLLDDLQKSVEMVEKGIPLKHDFAQAVHHGSSIGGARPKVLIESGKEKLIAKFSSTTDIFNIVKAEYIAMRLAEIVGLNVARVKLTQALKKDVLLIGRFDRIYSKNNWQRKQMVSALTLLELDEMMARYASYQDLAHIIRHRFSKPKETLTELFSRIIFNILCGNNDDHARNHAAFWNGEFLELTPAYDICPQSRVGNETSQAMLIQENDNRSRLKTCFDAAHHFLLSQQQAHSIAKHQIKLIIKHWTKICDEASLSEVERNLMWKRQFLNPYAFDGLENGEAFLSK